MLNPAQKASSKEVRAFFPGGGQGWPGVLAVEAMGQGTAAAPSSFLHHGARMTQALPRHQSPPGRALLVHLVLQRARCHAPSPGCFLPSGIAWSALSSHRPARKIRHRLRSGCGAAPLLLPWSPASRASCKEHESTAWHWQCTFSTLWQIM